MKDLTAIIEAIDVNGDGKLTYEEVKAVLKQVGHKVRSALTSYASSFIPITTRIWSPKAIF